MNGAKSLIRSLTNAGVNEVGERAASLFDLTRPHIDFVQLANSMGVPGTVATTAEDLARELALSFSQAGPFVKV